MSQLEVWERPDATERDLQPLTECGKALAAPGSSERWIVANAIVKMCAVGRPVSTRQLASAPSDGACNGA